MAVVDPGGRQLARMISIALTIAVAAGLSGCTSITYNCNAAASCPPLASTSAPATPAKVDPKG